MHIFKSDFFLNIEQLIFRQNIKNTLKSLGIVFDTGIYCSYVTWSTKALIAAQVYL